MTKRMFFALALTLGLIPMQAQAQLPTLLTVSGSVGGGLSLYTPSVPSGVTAPNYTGFNFGGKLKVGLPLSPVIIVGHLALNQLSANQSNTDFTFQIFSAGAGIEYIIVPLPLFSPYIALDAALHSSKLTKPEIAGLNNQVNRTGIGIGAGAEIGIPLSPISIDVEAKYRFANLIGRESGEESANYVQIWATLVFKLL